MDEVVRTVTPPPEGILCPQCGGLRYFNGMFSVGLMADGSIVTERRRGNPCPTCHGKGRVKEIVVVPFDD